MIQIDQKLLDELFAKARESERKRMNYDLRTSADDNSQRMLNALLPGTEVPIHRHPNSTENVLLLSGKIVEIIYGLTPNPSPNGEGSLVEVERIVLDPSVGSFGCVVPKGAWHTVEVLEPSVIYEAKDGKYGEDGSEGASPQPSKEASPQPSKEASPQPSPEERELKKSIEYLIGMERHSGSMDAISPLYVSRMLNVPLEDVERCMKEMEG